MRLLVQKFGGTSLSTEEGRLAAARHVEHSLRRGWRSVVVVSAMGRKGDPYATDTLLDLVAAERDGIDPRDLALLVSCGEIIAAATMVATLQRLGLQATVLTGAQAGILTEEKPEDARILRVEPHRVRRVLEEGRVPVVAGFQGVSPRGEVTTLGRGGSDTTAVALGAALGAEAVEIFTDVNGVHTADPRMVPNARHLDCLTYEEVVQMASEGARILHPRAVEIAMRSGLPLWVRNTFENSNGTFISFRRTEVRHGSQGDRSVTGLAHVPHLGLFVVRGPWDAKQNREKRSDGEIFRALADAGISVDMINVSPDRKAFVVREECCEPCRRILEGFGLEVDMTRDCTKVTVVGTEMRGRPGVMARIAEALEREGIRILLSVDSHLTISCLVRSAETERALRVLHEEFRLHEAADGGGNDDLEGVRPRHHGHDHAL